MEYLIVTLVKGEAEQYHQKLLYEIATVFSLQGAIKRKPPSHITFKYNFKTDDIFPIEKAISDFCNNNSKAPYTVKGMHCFDEDVIFIDVFPSSDMKAMYLDFIESLKRNTDLEISGFDGITHFHMSLAHTDVKPKFKEVFAYVSKENPYFECVCDNITLLRKVDGIWTIYKEFLL